VERHDEIDHALEVAVGHTREAQDALVQEPPGTPRSVDIATDVVQRAEDVDVLATEARETVEGQGPPGA
jgi:hypothetical protein